MILHLHRKHQQSGSSAEAASACVLLLCAPPFSVGGVGVAPLSAGGVGRAPFAAVGGVVEEGMEDGGGGILMIGRGPEGRGQDMTLRD